MGEDLQHLGHVLLVFPERREVNLDAALVSSSKDVQKRAEHVVGEVLEGRRRVGQSERHNQRLEEAVTSAEGRFPFFAPYHADQIVRPAHVQFCVVLGAL